MLADIADCVVGYPISDLIPLMQWRRILWLIDDAECFERTAVRELVAMLMI